IAVGNERDPMTARGLGKRRLAQNGDGTLLHRIADELAAIGLGARQCSEKESRPHLAAICCYATEILHAHCPSRGQSGLTPTLARNYGSMMEFLWTRHGNRSSQPIQIVARNAQKRRDAGNDPAHGRCCRPSAGGKACTRLYAMWFIDHDEHEIA